MNLFFTPLPHVGNEADGAICKCSSVAGRGSFLSFLTQGNSDHVFCVNSEAETY